MSEWLDKLIKALDECKRCRHWNSRNEECGAYCPCSNAEIINDTKGGIHEPETIRLHK